MIIAVDFDGTIVEHRYPRIGKELPFAFDTLRKLHQDGHVLILWTMREGTLLQEAVDFCRQNGLTFDAVNENYLSEDEAVHPRKLHADLFIDDRNVGGLPDWGTIYLLISKGLTWGEVEGYLNVVASPKKKGGWWKRMWKGLATE
jgi:hypothetical protein